MGEGRQFYLVTQRNFAWVATERCIVGTVSLAIRQRGYPRRCDLPVLK